MQNVQRIRQARFKWLLTFYTFIYFCRDLFPDIKVLAWAFGFDFWPDPKSRCAHRRHVRINAVTVAKSVTVTV